MGARVSSAFHPRLTHVVARGLGTSKARDALKEGIPVVSVQWLEEAGDILLFLSKFFYAVFFRIVLENFFFKKKKKKFVGVFVICVLSRRRRIVNKKEHKKMKSIHPSTPYIHSLFLVPP